MSEREKIAQHIETLFESAGAPDSRASIELREELLTNSVERHADLVAGGMEEEAALQSVLASIGSVEELIASLPPDATIVQLQQMQAERRQKHAVFATIATALYIIAGLVMVAGQFFMNSWVFGFVAGIGIAIIPTCLLVYSSIAFPRYDRQTESVVEQFKEYTADSKRVKAIKGALSTILWLASLAVYFLLSFATGAWHITWVLFLVAACLEAVIMLVFALKGK